MITTCFFSESLTFFLIPENRKAKHIAHDEREQSLNLVLNVKIL